MIRYTLPEPVDGLAGVAFKVWKQRFFHVWPRLRERGLVRDWRHEGYRIALEAAAEGLRYGDRALPGFVYRAWYDFLVRYGFIRPRGNGTYVQREIPVGEFGEGFFEKARELLEEHFQKIPFATARGLRFNGRYYFTAHFIKRWKERIPLRFSPRCVVQQLALAQLSYTLRTRTGAVKVVAKCPWFSVVYTVRKDGGMAFITVF